MLHLATVLAEQDPGELVSGLTAIGRGIVYGGAAIGPGIGIGIVVGNLWEIIPVAQMPVNARIAFPALMAITVWVLYHFIGIKEQGLGHYLKGNMFIPGVPKPMYVLVTPIETVTFLITQPLSLAVRLFANMLAGHLLLVSFATITAAVFALSATIVIWPFSIGLLIGLTAFEVLVAFLQAFIFTILTAVYIGGAMHPEH